MLSGPLSWLKENDIHYRTGSVNLHRCRPPVGRFACLVAFAAGSWPGVASAQDKPAERPGEQADPYSEDENQVVITGTRSKEAAGKSVVRVDVVTREEAKRRGATNVGEALAGELGMQVNPAAYGSIGQPSAAQIGGFDRERVLVLQDGERVVGDVGGAVDLAQLSLGGVSRIEIVQGPSSALYGTSAIGGVINVISGSPELEGWSGRFQIEGRERWGGLAAAEVAYRADDN